MNLTNICDDVSFSHTKSFRPSLSPSCKTLLIGLSHYLQAFSSSQFIFQKKKLISVPYLLYQVVIHSSVNNKKKCYSGGLKNRGSFVSCMCKLCTVTLNSFQGLEAMFLLYSSYYVGLHYDAICCLNARWLLYLQSLLPESQEEGRRMKRTRKTKKSQVNFASFSKKRSSFHTLLTSSKEAKKIGYFDVQPQQQTQSKEKVDYYWLLDRQTYLPWKSLVNGERFQTYLPERIFKNSFLLTV